MATSSPRPMVFVMVSNNASTTRWAWALGSIPAACITASTNPSLVIFVSGRIFDLLAYGNSIANTRENGNQGIGGSIQIIQDLPLSPPGKIDKHVHIIGQGRIRPLQCFRDPDEGLRVPFFEINRQGLRVIAGLGEPPQKLLQNLQDPLGAPPGVVHGEHVREIGLHQENEAHFPRETASASGYFSWPARLNAS